MDFCRDTIKKFVRAMILDGELIYDADIVIQFDSETWCRIHFRNELAVAVVRQSDYK